MLDHFRSCMLDPVCFGLVLHIWFWLMAPKYGAGYVELECMLNIKLFSRFFVDHPCQLSLVTVG